MKTIVYLYTLLAVQLLFSQTDYNNLAKNAPLLQSFTTPETYFPKVGYDELYDYDYEFEANKNFPMQEANAVFTSNFEYFDKQSYYFTIGKIETTSQYALIYYAVEKNSMNGSLEGTYYAAIFNSNKKMIHNFSIGTQYSFAKDVRDHVILDKRIFQSDIIKKDKAIVFTTTLTMNKLVRMPETNELTTQSITREQFYFNENGQRIDNFSPKML